MPDAEGPGTPEQQVRFEVALDKTLRAVAGMFGADHQPQAGGGGNGKWVFTSVEQLDSLIKRWTEVRDATYIRRDKIRDAQQLVQAPAGDIMSRIQANAFKDSLQVMRDHAHNMYTYADAYVQKLKTTRSEYMNTESTNAASMNNRDKD